MPENEKAEENQTNPTAQNPGNSSPLDASSQPNPDRASDEDKDGAPTKEEQAHFTLEDTEITEDQLIKALKDCYDPEIPVNLYDLGLIHEVRASGEKVEIDMTLTAPGCGFGPQIAKNVEARLLEEDDVDEAFVEIVHDPPWDRSMVSEEGQAQLNMLGF